MSLEVLFALVSRTISRVMSRMIIYLGVSSPKPSSNLPESGPGRSLLSAWSCSGWGLHSPSRYRDGGSLLHCHSTLTQQYAEQFIFCCTGLGVASTGCYPASCPVEPGLSSPAPFRLCSRDHLFYLRLLASAIFQLYRKTFTLTIISLILPTMTGNICMIFWQ